MSYPLFVKKDIDGFFGLAMKQCKYIHMGYKGYGGSFLKFIGFISHPSPTLHHKSPYKYNTQDRHDEERQPCNGLLRLLCDMFPHDRRIAADPDDEEDKWCGNQSVDDRSIEQHPHGIDTK